MITRLDVHDEEAVEAAQRGARRWRATEGLREADLDVGLLRRTEMFDIWRDAIAFPTGEKGTHLRIAMAPEVNPGAAVLVTSNRRVVILVHDRYVTGGRHLEIPRGFGSPKLSPEQTVRKELIEELALSYSNLIRIGEMHVNTGLSDERCVLFFAEARGVPKPKHAEGIVDCLLLSPKKVAALIASDAITDGFTLAAFAKASAQGLLRF